VSAPEILFSADEIAARIRALARDIAAMPRPPDLIVGILVGAFVFVADLSRALSNEGLTLAIEFLWLRSYDGARDCGAVQTRMGPSQNVARRHVLLIDGVLDRGATLATAKALLREAGAASVATVVAVDKRRADALLVADHAAFTHVADFVVGYGMDDGETGRALPYIARIRPPSA
jgi:hypoxanthine phosphoribosyltransferase